MGRVNTFQDTGSGGSISIDRSTFTNSVGSAVSISEVLSDIISISKSSFSRNNNAGLGGALFIQNVQGSVSVTGSDFSENTAVLGGALYIAGGIVNVSVTGSDFSENRAEGPGGALFLAGFEGSVSVTGSDFSENASKGGGGALSITNAGSVSVTESDF